MSNPEHIVINRAELAELLVKSRGLDPQKVRLLNLDIMSSAHQRGVALYRGDWTDAECPFDLISFTIHPAEGQCCLNEQRNMNGGCDNCGDPCL